MMAQEIKLYCVKKPEKFVYPDDNIGYVNMTHKCMFHELIVNVNSSAENKIIGLNCYDGFFVKSRGFGSFPTDDGSLDELFDDPLFYLTFNTFDGKKQVKSVNYVEEIESIVLEYKNNCIETKFNHDIQFLNKPTTKVVGFVF
jgi:hypothetical protein